MRFLCLFLLCFSTALRSEELVTSLPSYTNEVCENETLIASEFIEAEFAGIRRLGVEEVPDCVKKLHLKTFVPEHVSQGDAFLLEPEYLIPEKRNLQFKVKHLPDDLLEVSLSYLGKKKGKSILIKDQIILKLNYGKVRELRGCASIYSDFERFSMNAKCYTH